MIISRYTVDTSTIEVSTIQDIDKTTIDVNIVNVFLESIGDKIVTDPEYVDKMRISIVQGLAYESYIDGIRVLFFYTYFDDNGKLKGASMCKVKDHQYLHIALAAMLKAMMLMVNGKAQSLSLNIHGNNINYLKSLLVGSSIRMYNGSEIPYVTIALKDQVPRWKKLCTYFGVVEEVV